MNERGRKAWAYLIGAGMALFPIHNQWLNSLTTDSSGAVTFFVPALGAILWIVGALWFLVDAKVDKLDARDIAGDKKITMPLLVIVAAIALSGVAVDGSIGTRLAPALTAIALFAVYLATRILGRAVFIPLAIGAAIASVGVVIQAVITPGVLTGGLVFEGNYDIVVGYILLGALLYDGRWRLGLNTLVAIALFLTGSPEGLFAGTVVTVVFVWRNGVDAAARKGVGTAAAVGVVILVWFSFGLGWGQQLYSYTIQAAKNESAQPATSATLRTTPDAPHDESHGSPQARQAVGYRLDVIKAAMTHIQPLGTGYVLTAFNEGIVHNVPLIIVQELGWPGVLAGAAWVWVTGYCLVKRRQTAQLYVWTAVFALSVWDHFMWDQLVPVWWAAAGLAAGELRIPEREQLFPA